MQYNENSVLSYGIYMMNRWSFDESKYLFGSILGEHIWNKWMRYMDDFGIYGAPMKLLFELDSTNYELIVERACSLYDGRRNL